MNKYKGIGISAVFLAVVGLIALYPTPGFAAVSCDGPRAANVSIQHNFNAGNLNAWSMPSAEDWEILKESDLHYLHMKRNRSPELPRHPVQFALLKNVKVGSFSLDVKVRSIGHSMLVVFNYVDPLHFYYVHLSDVPGTEISVHNGIFIVDGGPRHRIAGMTASPALPDHSWHQVRIVRDARTGSIQVFLDKETAPRFSVVDHTFSCGQVGFGSFDETGDFARIRLRSIKGQRSAAAKN